MDEFMFFEVEWWSSETGGEVMDGVKVALRVADPDRYHVYNREVLDVAPDMYGEMSVWFSFKLGDWDYRQAVDRVRDVGYRVKTAGVLPASLAAASWREFMDWLYADDAATVAAERLQCELDRVGYQRFKTCDGCDATGAVFEHVVTRPSDPSSLCCVLALCGDCGGYPPGVLPSDMVPGSGTTAQLDEWTELHGFKNGICFYE